MKRKKILVFSLITLFILILGGIITFNFFNDKEIISLDSDVVKELYDIIEPYYITDIYEEFDTYSNDNFYIDKYINYDDLREEARLYYAYKTIDNFERKWISTCDEIKSYIFNNEDVYQECINSNGEILQKDSGNEWKFNNVNKEILEKAYHKTYGNDKEFPLTDFTMDYNGACAYSKEKDDFLCFHQVGGEIKTESAITKLEKAVSYKDTIELYDRYVWKVVSGENFEQTSYYKSHINKSELIQENNSTTEINNKGALYKHTFKKDNNDNYHWYSSERIE